MQANTENYIVSDKAKRISIALIAVGIIAVVAGFLTGHAERTWANLLTSSYFFTCITLGGIMFCAIQYVAQAGWSVVVVRIAQAFSAVQPVAAIILLLVVGIGLGTHSLYHHWADPNLLKEYLPDGKTPNPEFDEIIAGKSSFLNVPFFIARLVIYMVVWGGLGYYMRKLSHQEDIEGGMKFYKKSITISAVFAVLFAFTVPLFAFDLMMSVEAHWFSTMFGWYNLAGLWVSTLAAIALTVIFLKEAGYLEYVNENHMHDLGKFVFAFSIFWTYTWVSQFLLIYYANLPEEVSWFYNRWQSNYIWLFWIDMAVNFLFPLLVLMSRGAKRSYTIMKIVCSVVILTHWLDFYMMVMPGTVGKENGIGYIELGTLAGFVGLFMFFMLRALAKKPLLPKNHPFLEESLHHEVV